MWLSSLQENKSNVEERPRSDQIWRPPSYTHWWRGSHYTCCSTWDTETGHTSDTGQTAYCWKSHHVDQHTTADITYLEIKIWESGARPGYVVAIWLTVDDSGVEHESSTGTWQYTGRHKLDIGQQEEICKKGQSLQCISQQWRQVTQQDVIIWKWTRCKSVEQIQSCLIIMW